MKNIFWGLKKIESEQSVVLNRIKTRETDMTRTRSVFLFHLVFILMFGYASTAQLTGKEPEEVNSIFILSQLKEKTHPYLLFSKDDLPGLRKKLDSGWLSEAREVLINQANEYLSLKGPVEASAVAGRRLHRIVNTLVYAAFLVDQPVYIHKAIDILMATSNKYSADDYDAMNEHLAVGDAAHAFAIAYDWLESELDAEQREVILQKIQELGGWIYNHSTHNSYYGSPKPPQAGCNHNVVMNSSLGLCALALKDHPEWLDLAVRQTRAYFIYSLDENGYNYEGFSYYGYGALASMAFSAALLNCGGPDLLLELPKIRLMPEYLIRHVLPLGSAALTIGDSHPRLEHGGGWMYVLSKFQDRVGLWSWLRMVGPAGDRSYANIADKAASSIPYVLIWADSELVPQSPAQAGTPFDRFYESGRGLFRDGWGELNSLVSFTCGYTTHRGHNQRDENSFTFYSRGEEFVIDPGYTPNTTESHSSVLIDGEGQERPADVYDIYGKNIGYKDLDQAQWIKGDATATYPERLGVALATRQLLFAGGKEKGAPQPYVIIVDDLKKRHSEVSKFSWLLQTAPSNSIEISSMERTARITGSNRGAKMKVQLLTPEEGEFHVPDLAGKVRSGVRNAKYRVGNHYKTLELKVTGSDVRIITCLVVSDPGEDEPELEYSGAPDNMQILIKFADGTADVIHIGPDSMDFKRDLK